MALPAGSEAERLATRASISVIALPESRFGLRDTGRMRVALDASRAEAVFVQGDAEHLATARELKHRGRGSLIRRIPAGDTITGSRAAGRAQDIWPTRYLYTSETPPTGHAAPSGQPPAMRAELGVAVPDQAPAPIRDGYAVLACVATRETLRRATHVLRAASLLAQQHVELRVRVIGTAAADPDLQVLASALGMARRVEWITQAASFRDVLDGVAAGWVVADQDDAGLGLLHLMAHGVVPLAERTPLTMRYVTPGVHGILMASLDPPGMAAETTVLLSDVERRETMVAAARSRVEREFSLRDMVKAFEQAARSSQDRRAKSE